MEDNCYDLEAIRDLVRPSRYAGVEVHCSTVGLRILYATAGGSLNERWELASPTLSYFYLVDVGQSEHVNCRRPSLQFSAGEAG